MTGHDSDDIEYLDRDAGLYWFDHAAWIARARIRCPHWYSAHASDFVDVLCWAFAEWHQNPENPDATTPTTSEEEEDTAPETEQTTLVTDGGQCKDDTERLSLKSRRVSDSHQVRAAVRGCVNCPGRQGRNVSPEWDGKKWVCPWCGYHFTDPPTFVESIQDRSLALDTDRSGGDDCG